MPLSDGQLLENNVVQPVATELERKFLVQVVVARTDPEIQSCLIRRYRCTFDPGSDTHSFYGSLYQMELVVPCSCRASSGVYYIWLALDHHFIVECPQRRHDRLEKFFARRRDSVRRDREQPLRRNSYNGPARVGESGID